jgi:[protein-PII] uridylyltransferase
MAERLVAGRLQERIGVIADRSRRGRDFCRALSDATDAFLVALFEEATGGDGHGVALVATGGYGRQELAPGSDLDVWLLHDGRADVGAVAERLWYPIWDAGMKLGHAVRTPREALELASEDLDTGTAALSARFIAGDRGLADAFVEPAADRWRKRGARWLDTLYERVVARQALAGEVAYLLEPDLKEGQGGLRDIHALRWAEAARPVMLPGDVEALREAEDTLLEIRVELHRVSGRPADVLVLERQDEVAAVLGDTDADALMARLATAGRAVAWISDEVWRRETTAPRLNLPKAFRRERYVSEGVALRDREIQVDRDGRLDDPTLVLRAALVAATYNAPIARESLDLLAEHAPVMPDPWPEAARESLVELLATGHAAIRVLESLDQRRLVERVLPEWTPVRSRPQRNALHRFTVDRHLMECAANASKLLTTVSRPDLLLVGALFHDLGKGYPGDHTDVGVELIARIGARMGFAGDDIALLERMVRLHLLLPDVATRRDLGDDDVIVATATAVGSLDALQLLTALTEADGLATGVSAWSPWKAELVRELVGRVAHVLRGGDAGELRVGDDRFPDAGVRDLMSQKRVAVRIDGQQLTVVAPDRPGLFSRVAGALTLKGLAVLGAEAGSEDGMAASQFRVDAGGMEVDWEEVVRDVRRAVDGRIALEARLATRARNGRRNAALRLVRDPSVRVDNTASGTSTIIEVHAPDRIGVLYHITRALADMDLDIRWAKVTTLGAEVVDSFYVRTATGEKVEDGEHIRELERAILHRLSL